MKDFPIAGTDMIQHSLSEPESKPTTLKQIMEEVCLKHAITLRELLSDRRHGHLVIARWEAFWRAYNETSLTLPAIGRAFNRDPSTVLHGIREHEKRISGG